MKSFRSIPGPSGYLPWQILTGSYNLSELHKSGYNLYRKYGPIVRQKVLPGVNLLNLFDPDDIAVVANDFSKKDFPHRNDHFALAKYRRDRPDIYANEGVIASNGQEWWRLRSSLQKNLSRPVYIRQFIGSTNGILNELGQALDRERELNPDQPIEIDKFLANLNLELIVYLTFGIRMDALSPEELRPQSNSTSLVAAAYEANSLTLELDHQKPIWSVWKTVKYRKYAEYLDVLQNGGQRLLETWKERVEDGSGEDCLMDYYAKDENLNEKDLNGIVQEYLLAGADTTAITTAMMLHHVARNPEVQQKIVEEINSVLKSDQEPTIETINNHIPYTRAVLKESLRLSPISIGFGRHLVKDMEIRGFMIPKNTTVVTQNYVACRLPENFHRPLDFLPNRWLKDSEKKKSQIHPYLVLAFGHGMRACIARRFAEQNMLLVLMKMIRSYEIKQEGLDKEMEIETLLINKPKSPVRLWLKRRQPN